MGIPNHSEDIGFTDCVMGSGDLVVTSSYDIDTGCGGVNIWCQDISLGDGDTGRIVSLGIRNDEIIVTGGRKLKIWTRVEAGNTSEDIVPGRIVRMFPRPRTDGGWTEASESDLSDEENTAGTQASNQIAMIREKKTGFCNCSLM